MERMTAIYTVQIHRKRDRDLYLHLLNSESCISTVQSNAYLQEVVEEQEPAYILNHKTRVV